MKKTILILLAGILAFSSCDLIKNIKDEVDELTSVSGDITTNTTWSKSVTVTGSIRVRATLVIEPGTVVKFNKDTYLSINAGGILKADGTSSSPIVFTSNELSPSAGDWRGIELESNANTGASSLSYCTIQYAGATSGYNTALYIDDNSMSVKNCTVKNCKGVGVTVDSKGEFVSFSGNTISDCEGYTLSVPANVIDQIAADNNLSGKGILINEENFTKKAVWQTFPIHYFANRIDITEDGELTLSPGTTIEFLEDGILFVGYTAPGKLTAIGTSEKPITFTSANTNKAAGDWRGVEFFKNAAKNSAIKYCNIQYAGAPTGYSANLYLCETSIAIDNCTISDGAGRGIFAYDSEFSSFASNTVKKCADYPLSIPADAVGIISADNVFEGKGVFINQEDVTKDATWQTLTIPYVAERIDIQNDATLTLSPGTTLSFREDGILFVGYGTPGGLVAVGTEEMPIVFTSALGNPYQGDWRGIEFFENVMPGTTLSHTKVLYGGRDTGYKANVYFYNTQQKASITDSEIAFSKKYGIYTNNCTPTLTNINYHDNGDQDLY